MKKNPRCLVLHQKDNIGLLTTSGGKPGQAVKIPGTKRAVRLKNAVPKGHKIAIKKIQRKDQILKFGQIIGLAKDDILPGEHVHIHNIKFSKGVKFSNKFLQTFTNFNVDFHTKIAIMEVV